MTMFYTSLFYVFILSFFFGCFITEGVVGQWSSIDGLEGLTVILSLGRVFLGCFDWTGIGANNAAMCIDLEGK